MRVSFDFDDVLSLPQVQSVAKEMIADGHEVYILTARFDDSSENVGWGKDWNDDLKAVAAELNIPKERWLFAGEGLKSHHAQAHGIQLHIDDDMGWVSDVRMVAMCVWFHEGRAERCLEEFRKLAQ